jgi:hypothetical protein
MALWEQIEPALEAALATCGVQQLVIDGDEKLWVAGLGALDGSLELRTGDRGARRGILRRAQIDRAALEALGFSERVDAWSLGLEPGPRLARRGAALLEQALTGALGAPRDARAEVDFERTGLVPEDRGAGHRAHLEAAVRVWRERPSTWIAIEAGRPSRGCFDLGPHDDGVFMSVHPPEGSTLAIPGFSLDEAGWPWTVIPRADLPRVADDVMHGPLAVREDEPLFVIYTPA